MIKLFAGLALTVIAAIAVGNVLDLRPAEAGALYVAAVAAFSTWSWRRSS